jgi:ketosteroid isomerase-like protein
VELRAQASSSSYWVAAMYADDIEWRVNGPSAVAGTYEGKDAVFAFFEQMMGQYEGTLKVEVTGMAADERHGFVWVRESATRPAEITYTGIHAWGFQDGRCSRFESYYDDDYYEFWSGRRESAPDA